MAEYYVGLMSGTSFDGIDAALVDFGGAQPQLMATHYHPYPTDFRKTILDLCTPGDNEIERLAAMDVNLGQLFAKTTLDLLDKSQIPAHAIKAIGSHGQTIRHLPHQSYTLQIGDPNIIAAMTGITTIADFRRKDMAHGGQGAPLVPAFHAYLFASTIDRVIVNIGGMANVTLLPADKNKSVLGFDTGPGNVLMDAWIHRHQQTAHDESGQWAKQGYVQPALLAALLDDAYFSLSPPKSTGREHFNLAWLEKHIPKGAQAVDVQATLVDLTVNSILTSIQAYFQHGDILVCGGGAHNHFLMSRLKAIAGNAFNVDSTEQSGIPPDWIEAMAFAWLAQQTLNKKPGNLIQVTGAKQPAILGGIYHGH